MPSLHELISAGAARLKAAGIAADEADLDAQLLAGHVLQWDRTRLVTAWRDPAPDNFPAAFQPLVARRERREPISQILGKREFWGLEFEVTPDVLTPRPETEGVIEAVLEHAPKAAVIADIGTGSGCIAIALAKELPALRLVAIDISASALRVARNNAVRHAVTRRIAFVRARGAAAVRGVDAIVSNPPYIRSSDREALPPEVGNYEPPEALFAGEDGLEVIRALVYDAAAVLAPSGVLIFECGVDQGPAIREMIARATGLALVEIRPDLAGIPRTVVARRTR